MKYKVFNQFKNKELDIYQTIKLLEVFDKNNGVVYTPKHIVEQIINMSEYKPDETIYEPALGHGMFIFTLFEYLRNKYQFDDIKLIHWFNNYVYANEISKDKVKDFKKLIKIYFNDSSLIKFNNITVGDSLFKTYKQKFDVIISNPPYVKALYIDPNYLLKLKENYKSCNKGNIDLYFAFMELCTKIAKRTVMIVPNVFITNNSAKKIREIIKPYITELYNFKDELIFSSARTYTCIYKSVENESGKLTLLNENRIIDKHTLNNEKWNFSNYKLKNNKLDIQCGIATLRDYLYILDAEKIKLINNKEYFITSYKEQDFYIEKEITVDYIKLTKQDKKYVIIFPYHDDLSIFSENDLKNNFPYCYQYFLAIKEELGNRDKGKTNKYPTWFAYGRKQGLYRDYKPYHLLLPKMSTLPLKITLLNNNKRFLFGSGYIVNFNSKDDALKFKYKLESADSANILKNICRVYPGEKPYYTFSIKDFNYI